MNKFKLYYRLTKPGIVYSNTLAALGGYLFGTRGNVDIASMLAVVVGIVLVIASACVFNNYIDRDIDKKMKRTKIRALPLGQISGFAANAYATLLGFAGFLVLAFFTNWLTFWLGVLAYFSYIVLYGWGKRNTVHGTFIGTLPGALPPVAGYATATGRVDIAAGLIFLIMVFWQMPHFYAIAMMRYNDYKSAKLPVWPVVKGMSSAKRQIVFYIIGFLIFNILFFVVSDAGYVFVITMTIVGVLWLKKALQNYKTKDDNSWARGVFFFSLTTLMVFCLLLCIESWLP